MRYASLEKAFPEESKKLRAVLEEEYKARYQSLRLMAEDVVTEEKKTPEISESPATSEDDPSCVISATAEHSRLDNIDAPCDDGRAGK